LNHHSAWTPRKCCQAWPWRGSSGT
jgi:hypothetical protein